MRIKFDSLDLKKQEAHGSHRSPEYCGPAQPQGAMI